VLFQIGCSDGHQLAVDQPVNGWRSAASFCLTLGADSSRVPASIHYSRTSYLAREVMWTMVFPMSSCRFRSVSHYPPSTAANGRSG
jgi:hypothetical protein